MSYPPRNSHNRKRFNLAGVVLAISLLLASTGSEAQNDALLSGTTLTLGEAIEKTLKTSPRLQAAVSALRASKGELSQAGMWQNPEISFKSENFAGTGVYDGFSAAENTAEISQLVEMGGKPGRREAVAASGMEIYKLNFQIEKAQLVSEVRIAYANAVASEKKFNMAIEQKNLAEKLFDEVSQRVRAAREATIQKSKAKISLSSMKYEKEKAERELEHAKHVLSSYWGGHEKGFKLEDEYFYKVEPAMSEEAAEDGLEKGIYLKHMESRKSRMEAVLQLEQAQAIPDPKLSIGIRDHRLTNDQALIASVTMPLPVLNRNSGAVERARHDVSKSVSDKEATRLSLVNELHEALESMTNAYQNAVNLKEAILPSAKAAFTQARSGYNAGKFPYLEVLDSQRTLADINGQYVDALFEYHKSAATIDRLTTSFTAKQGVSNE